MEIEVGQQTAVGPKHERSEDATGANVSNRMKVIKEAPPLFAAADGVGGHQGGEIASSTAIETLMQHFQVHDGDPADELLEAVNKANEAVIKKKDEDERLYKMATTVVACSVTEEAAYIANVGDSRAYLIGKSGSIDRVTVDHSLVGEMQRRGMEVNPKTRRNIITRALGKDEELDVDMFYVRWEPGQAVVLCSDGVWDVLEETDIGRIVAEHNAQAAADAIIEKVKAIGPTDDMAVVVCKRLS